MALAVHISIGQAYAFSTFNFPLTTPLGVSHAVPGDGNLKQVGWIWFPDRPGMATGMAIMGFGGGALIPAPLSLLLMGHYRFYQLICRSLGAIHGRLLTAGSVAGVLGLNLGQLYPSIPN